MSRNPSFPVAERNALLCRLVNAGVPRRVLLALRIADLDARAGKPLRLLRRPAPGAAVYREGFVIQLTQDTSRALVAYLAKYRALLSPDSSAPLFPSARQGALSRSGLDMIVIREAGRQFETITTAVAPQEARA